MAYAVIFDIDGVLIDSYQSHLESWRALGREVGQTVTQAQFAASFGRTSRAIIRLWWGDVLGEGLTDGWVGELDERKEALYRAVLRERRPIMAGAVELIDALAGGGFRLAVGSSGPAANVALSLEILGRAERFSARVTGDDVTRGKPDPQVFLLAAQRLGVGPARCAVIEDAPAGIEAANAAGMTSIGLTGTAEAAALATADHVVGSLGELSRQVIGRWIGASLDGD